MKDVIDLISQGKDWIEYSRLRYLGKHLMQFSEGAKINSPLTRPKVNMKSSNSASVGSSDHEIDKNNNEN